MQLAMSGYVVLGLIARHGPMTPYELKARVEESVGFFWPIPHAQLYRDPPRLADLGLLREDAEAGGRRRRIFHLTADGERALREWLASPETPPADARDPAQLKLAFADLAEPDDIVRLARRQADQHRELLAGLQDHRSALSSGDAVTVSRSRLLDLGILHEQAHATFWATLADAGALDAGDALDSGALDSGGTPDSDGAGGPAQADDRFADAETDGERAHESAVSDARR